MKYTREILKKIYELKASGEFNDKEIQGIVGVSYETWAEWKRNKVEFSELLKKADNEFIEEKLKTSARKGLKTLLEGKEWEEVSKEFKDVNGTPKKIKETRVKKFIMPNAISVIFALKNTDPEHFKDKQEIEHSVKQGTKIKWGDNEIEI